MRHIITLIAVFALGLVASACDSKEAVEKKDDTKAKAQAEAEDKAEAKAVDEKKADAKAETKTE